MTVTVEDAVNEIGEGIDIEERLLFAAACEDTSEFVRLSLEYEGGLEAAQRLVRTRGIVSRPAPPPTLKWTDEAEAD